MLVILNVSQDTNALLTSSSAFPDEELGYKVIKRNNDIIIIIDKSIIVVDYIISITMHLTITLQIYLFK